MKSLTEKTGGRERGTSEERHLIRVADRKNGESGGRRNGCDTEWWAMGEDVVDARAKERGVVGLLEFYAQLSSTVI